MACPFCASGDTIEETFSPYPHEEHPEITVYEKAVQCRKCKIGTMCRGTKHLNSAGRPDKEWSTRTILKRLISSINSPS